MLQSNVFLENLTRFHFVVTKCRAELRATFHPNDPIVTPQAIVSKQLFSSNCGLQPVNPSALILCMTCQVYFCQGHQKVERDSCS